MHQHQYENAGDNHYIVYLLMLNPISGMKIELQLKANIAADFA